MDRKVYEFISQKTNDPIIEWKTCKVSWEEFPIYQSDREFYDKISPVINGKKYTIPSPKLCPDERQRRRLSFRNERKLYKRNCDATGRQIISMYSENTPYKVYDQKYRRSDTWDAIEYGMNFDFSKSFNEQFSELLLKVPSFNLINIDSTNSEYANHAYKLENSYMCFSSLESKWCINTRWAITSSECHDGCFLENSEVCYDCTSCSTCYKVFHSNECVSCANSYYLSNCIGCEYCFNCSNLQNKKYCINNIQYTEQEYKTAISTAKREYIQAIKVWQNQQNCSDSYWNNLINCSHCSFVGEMSDSENSKYTFDDGMQKNCYDCYGWSKSEYWLELMACAHSYGTMFVCYGNNNINVWYSNKTYNCQDCFWCVWLKYKQYCIFNKQYTKDEYEKLISKIIEHMQTMGEWWEFFMPSLSPFGYNETVANDYFPLTKEEILSKWYKRSDYEAPFPQVEGIIQWKDLPVNITEIDDSILSNAVACEVTGKPFRIIKPELEFYRKYNISLPHKHPDIRHQERIQKRPSKNLHLRTCDACMIETLSVYDESHQGKIYCEECYVKEIYW